VIIKNPRFYFKGLLSQQILEHPEHPPPFFLCLIKYLAENLIPAKIKPNTIKSNIIFRPSFLSF